VKISVIAEASPESTSEVDVSDSIFAVRFNEPLVHQAVVAYQAGGRQGTRAQKNRAAARGGGAKPWRQKGTGRARAGTIRSPLWRGGGKIFAASTHDFSQKLNKKMQRGAMRSMLSELVRQGRLLTIDGFQVTAPKTQVLVEKLNKLGVDDALIVTENMDQNLWLSSRNLPQIHVCDVSHIDPVSLLRRNKVVMTIGAIRRLEERLG
jgi:large subunit ribosomal protein L4